MTQMDFINALNAFQSNAYAYAQASLLTYPQFGISRVVGDRGNVGPYIVSSDWAGLSAYCQGKLSSLASSVASLENEQSQINGLYGQLFALKSSFSTYYLSPGSNPSWISRRAQLSIDLVNQGMSVADSETLLTNLDTKGGQNGYEFVKGTLAQFPNLMSFALERHLSLRSYYYHTKAVADYNLIVGVPQVLAYNVSNKINSIASGIKTRQTALYTKINASDFTGLINACNTYSTWIDTQMQSFIVPILAYCYQTRQAVGSSFTTDGRRAMKAGDLFQSAVYSKALFAWVKWTAQWHSEVKQRKDLVSKASSLANSPISIAGTTVSVANLHNHPATYNGVDVVTEGELSNLVITHVTATKVVSTANVQNSSGVAVKVVLPHFKLDSGGLVNGCYVKLSGKFLQVNPEASNMPALSIARYAMSSLANTNWNAWLRQQLLTVYEQVTHNLEATFSAEPGGDGVINPSKYSTSSAGSNSLKITNKVY